MSTTARKQRITRKQASANGAAFRTLLVPTDFSAASRAAISFARDWSAAMGARIILLHVLQPIYNPDMSAFGLLAPDAKAKRDLRDRLQKLGAELGLDEDCLQEVLIREGIPFDEITKAARQNKADTIVISTHGYTGLKRVVLGSTTERVVRHARCPVFVIPAKA